MINVNGTEKNLREALKPSPDEDLMIGLTEQYLCYLRKYYPLRFLRMLHLAGKNTPEN